MQVHEDWPRRLAEMCAEQPSVERLIHVSCLGADPASPSTRLATRGRGDEAVRQAFEKATIMRFAPLVGVEDRFFNDMAQWIYSNSGAPVVDGGSSKVQPVYVVDAAESIHKTLLHDDAAGATYELGGPETMQCVPSRCVTVLDLSPKTATSMSTLQQPTISSLSYGSCKSAGCVILRISCVMR